MMLYPKIKKKNNILINVIATLSIFISGICILINKLTTPDFKWSYIVVVSILYTLITTLYSIKKNINIAYHVLLQVIAISILTILLDIIIGFRGWSIILAVPIAIVTGNVTMVVLTIVSRKKYFHYALYQLILSFFSGVFLLWVFFSNKSNVISLSITFGISVFTLLITIILCGKDLKEELRRLFHI